MGCRILAPAALVGLFLRWRRGLAGSGAAVCGDTARAGALSRLCPPAQRTRAGRNGTRIHHHKEIAMKSFKPSLSSLLLSLAAGRQRARRRPRRSTSTPPTPPRSTACCSTSARPRPRRSSPTARQTAPSRAPSSWPLVKGIGLKTVEKNRDRIVHRRRRRRAAAQKPAAQGRRASADDPAAGAARTRDRQSRSMDAPPDRRDARHGCRAAVRTWMRAGGDFCSRRSA